MKYLTRTILFLALLLLIASVNAATPVLSLSSPAFNENGVIPNQFTYSMSSQCKGENLSPPLEISETPANTQSFALTVYDPDGGDWLHWKAWNIPAYTVRILQNATTSSDFEQGTNSFGTSGYGGPCPPTPNHRYVFTLYALNTVFTSEPTIAQLQNAAIETSVLTGYRSPSDDTSWSQSTTDLIDADRVFNWLESEYSQFLAPATKVSQQAGGYYFRQYSQTMSFIAENNGSLLYVYLAGSNWKILDLGATSTWLPMAESAGF